MPKQLTAQNIASVSGLRFILDNVGKVTGLEATCEVNYGDRGITETVDLWPLLNTSQQQVAQNVYNTIRNKLEDVFVR